MFNPSDLLDHLQRLSPTPHISEGETTQSASHEQQAPDTLTRNTGGTMTNVDDQRNGVPDYPSFDQLFHQNSSRIPAFASTGHDFQPHSNAHHPFAHPNQMFMMGATNMFPGSLPYNAMNPMMYRDFPRQNSSEPNAASSASSDQKAPKKEIKRRRKKPRDCPKRPLSAYNLFFKDERKRILESIPDESKKKKDDVPEITWPGKKKTPHRKIGFENLAKTIGQRWKEIDPKQLNYYKELAVKDLQRYADEMKKYEKRQSFRKYSDSEEEDEIRSKKEKRRSSEREDTSSKSSKRRHGEYL